MCRLPLMQFKHKVLNSTEMFCEYAVKIFGSMCCASYFIIQTSCPLLNSNFSISSLLRASKNLRNLGSLSSEE